MQINVYHIQIDKMSRGILTDVLLSPKEDQVRRFWQEGHYIRVATVECLGLINAWELTQNIEDSWTNGPQVVECSSKSIRSSMVGDVFEMCEMPGIYYYANAVGFSPLVIK